MNSANSSPRLAERLGAADEQIVMHARLAEADNSGRPPQPGGMPFTRSAILRIAEALQVASAAPIPVLLGRRLTEAGYATGPQLGVILPAGRSTARRCVR